MSTSVKSGANVSIREFPVSVVIERRSVHGSKWETNRWGASNVIAGQVAGTGEDQAKVLSSDPDYTQFLWGGYYLELHKDDAESYYFNLQGEQPSVFVVCEELEDEEGIKPLLVTVSADEAASYDEVNEQVYAVPMPPEVYVWLEHYVVENYVPSQRKKRKRKNWREQGVDSVKKA